MNHKSILCYVDKNTGKLFYLFEGIPPRHRSWVRQPQYDKLVYIKEE